MAERERNGSPPLGRQKSAGSIGSHLPTPAPSLHVRSVSQPHAGAALNSVKKSQNNAAKAAAARLAQVMQANRESNNDDDEEDIPLPRYSSYLSNARDATRDQPPQLMRSYDTTPAPLGGTLRPVPTARSVLRPTTMNIPAPVIQRPSRPSVLPINPASLRSTDPVPDALGDRTRRFPSDLSNGGVGNDLSGPNSRRETAALRDEIDMLSEENESLLEKLRVVEEKFAEKDLRSRELEKQVTALGEGISLESRLLNRKEQFLKQREAALKAAKEQSKDVKDDEIAQMRLEAEAARDEAVAASETAREAEIEVKALRTMTHRMILTQEEMEEVVLKRCWLARHWALAAKHGIHPEIANSKQEFWSSLAPLPLEVVLSAGQRAKEEPSSRSQLGSTEDGRKKKATRDVNDITGEGNIESMLAVEKGLRELALLKVEDAVLLALARHRQPSSRGFDASKPADGVKSNEVFDLSPQEVEDVQFKQAWLIYFWRRAKSNGVEEDIADERIQLWISRTMQQPTLRDEVDVERGLMELRKLGVEEQLWSVSRREIAHEAANQKVDVLEVLVPASLQRVTSGANLHSG